MHISYQRVLKPNTFRTELFIQDMAQPHSIIGYPCFELTQCPHRCYCSTPYEPFKMRTLLFLEKQGSNYSFILFITENKGKLNNIENKSFNLTLVIPCVYLIRTRYKFQSNTTIYYIKYSYGNMFRLYRVIIRPSQRTDPMYQNLQCLLGSQTLAFEIPERTINFDTLDLFFVKA